MDHHDIGLFLSDGVVGYSFHKPVQFRLAFSITQMSEAPVDVQKVTWCPVGQRNAHLGLPEVVSEPFREIVGDG